MGFEITPYSLDECDENDCLDNVTASVSTGSTRSISYEEKKIAECGQCGLRTLRKLLIPQNNNKSLLVRSDGASKLLNASENQDRVVDVRRESKPAICFEYPSLEIMRKKIEEVFPVTSGMGLKKDVLAKFKYKVWFKSIQSIDNDGRVQGSCTVRISNMETGPNYTAVLKFDAVSEGIENLYVYQIKKGISDQVVYQHQVYQDQEPEINVNSIPPKWVLFIRQKYNTLTEAIEKCPSDALILVKYHLFRPDEHGHKCLAAINSVFPTPLELVKLCLPSKSYLRDNAHLNLIDELYKAALKSGKHEIAQYLSNSEKVRNCPERDAYFVDWFNYELRRLGAKDGETLESFMDRTNLTYEIPNFISNCPFEVQKIIPKHAHFKNSFWNSFFNHQPWGHNRFNMYCLAVRYNLCSYVRYWETQPSKGWWGCDAFFCLMFTRAFDDPRFMEMIKKVFPTKEERTAHPEKLNEYLDDIMWQVYGINKENGGNGTVMLQFLKNEGVDFKAIAKTTKHPEINKLLKDKGMI